MVATAKSSPDEAFMDQALTLADRGRGHTSPNPMVGAVVVTGKGAVVGTGYHERAGMAHAEVKSAGRGPRRRPTKEHAMRRCIARSSPAVMSDTPDPACIESSQLVSAVSSSGW